MAICAPELLTAAHDVAGFDCGKPALNDWLAKRALANQDKGFTVVMVVHDENRVVGYYGLAPTAVVRSAPPRSIRIGQAPDPIPCVLLGQLAIDIGYAGQGVGGALLAHALARSVEASRLVGGRALVVHAIDDDARQYWRRRGFLASLDDPFQLFRSMQDIAASVVEALSTG